MPPLQGGPMTRDLKEARQTQESLLRTMKEQSLRGHTIAAHPLPLGSQYEECIQLDPSVPFARKAMDENFSDEMVDKRDYNAAH